MNVIQPGEANPQNLTVTPRPHTAEFYELEWQKEGTRTTQRIQANSGAIRGSFLDLSIVLPGEEPSFYWFRVFAKTTGQPDQEIYRGKALAITAPAQPLKYSIYS